MPATYESIATTTLGTAASSITFSSISSAYTDLRVVFFAKGSGTTPRLTYNSDNGTNYSHTDLYGIGSGSGASSREISNNYIFLAGMFDLGTNFQFYTLDIFSYAGSANKTCLITASADQNGSGGVDRAVGLWRNTSAINTIKLQHGNGAGNFDIGTTATLYGIKNA